jgi:hypothetical protein
MSQAVCRGCGQVRANQREKIINNDVLNILKKDESLKQQSLTKKRG